MARSDRAERVRAGTPGDRRKMAAAVRTGAPPSDPELADLTLAYARRRLKLYTLAAGGAAVAAALFLSGAALGDGLAWIAFVVVLLGLAFDAALLGRAHNYLDRYDGAGPGGTTRHVAIGVFCVIELVAALTFGARHPSATTTRHQTVAYRQGTATLQVGETDGKRTSLRCESVMESLAGHEPGVRIGSTFYVDRPELDACRARIDTSEYLMWIFTAFAGITLAALAYAHRPGSRGAR